MNETEFLMSNTLTSSRGVTKDQGNGSSVKKASVKFADNLKEVREYTVTSSEDSAEDEDQNGGSGGRGETGENEVGKYDNSAILEEIAKGSLFKTYYAKAATTTEETKPKTRSILHTIKNAPSKISRFAVTDVSTSPINITADRFQAQEDASKKEATVVLSCEAGSSPFTPRYLRLSEGTSVNIGRSIFPSTESSLDASADFRCYPHDHNALFDCKVLSRQHAVITYRSSQFYIRDLNSSNGTFLVVESGKICKVTEKDMEVFTSDVVQLGVDVPDATGRSDSRFGTLAGGGTNSSAKDDSVMVHKPVIARMKLVLPSGKLCRERTRRDGKVSTDVRDGGSGGAPTSADAMLSEIRRTAKQYFAQHEKGERLMEKLDRLERLLVTNNNANYAVTSNDLTVTKSHSGLLRRTSDSSETDARHLFGTDQAVTSLKMADLSQIASRVSVKLGELEAKMQSQESSVIEKRLELVEKKTSLSYELLKSSNNAIIYLSLFFAILMMAIALRDGVRDQRRLTIW